MSPATGPVPPLVPTEVHPLDINLMLAVSRSHLQQFTDNDSAAAFLHSGWYNRRRRILDALVRAKVAPRRLQAFCECGASAWVQKSLEDEPRYRVSASWCRDRWCAVCASRRGREISARILADRDPRHLRFLTLTLRITPRGSAWPGEPGSLKYALDRLYKCFSRLRQTQLWKRATLGGAAFTEIKWSNASQGWHVHVHALIEGAYIPHPKIRDAWRRITGDSHIVDIRKVRTTTNAVRYVTTYVAKAFDAATERVPERLTEAIQALTARHLVCTFGSWRGTPLRNNPDPCEWVTVDTLEGVFSRMEAGDRHAYAIWEALRLRVGYTAPINACLDGADDP